MGTLIKELATRANVTYGQVGHKYSKSLYMASEGELEKFAELIIKECIKSCTTNMIHGTLMAETRIKEHFGIK